MAHETPPSVEAIEPASDGPLANVGHAVPAGQPDTVAQITARLFPAYTVHAGRVHLAGCTLEDRLFARLSYRVAGEPVELVVDGEGEVVEPGLCESLGLSQPVAIAKAPLLAVPLLNRFLHTILPQLEKRRFAGEEGFQRTSITAVWCKYAAGKLRFTIGKASVDLPFAGWAFTLQPPPWVCPHSGAHTFQLAMTDDGRIAACEQIAACQETGRRVLSAELVTCAATGARVLKERTSVCPVCNEPVLRHKITACAQCGELVSPSVIERGRCAACRGVRPVLKSDPRLARVLAAHTAFEAVRSWRLSETTDRYILVGTSWLRQVLLVVDKESLAIRRVARALRLFPRWEQITSEQYALRKDR